MDNPIFLAEELTLEAVKSRAHRINDSGDTDGWRMDFSVLYGDVLVLVSSIIQGKVLFVTGNFFD